MKSIGIVSGSFDPITNGHVWLIQEAATLVDELHVVMAENPEKKYFFSSLERMELLTAVLRDSGITIPLSTHTLSGAFLVDYAQEIGANRIIRGIRDIKDFEYERNMATINRSLAPNIPTVFVASPPDLTGLSSSAVRGLLGVKGWERVVGDQVHPRVLEALAKRAAK